MNPPPCTPAIYIARGPELRIVWANEAYLVMLGEGVTADVTIGKRLDEVSPMGQVHSQVLQEVMRTGEQRSGKDRRFSVEDGVAVHDWRAYRLRSDKILVMIGAQLGRGCDESTVPSDTDILIASQSKARGIMDAALDKAALLLSDAGDRATAVFAEQVERAAALLLEQQDLAIAKAQATRDEAEHMSPNDSARFLESQKQAAEILRQREEKVASEIYDTEQALARHVRDGVENEAASVLMDAHREVAAVLLEARMHVEERRGSRESSSGA